MTDNSLPVRETVPPPDSDERRKSYRFESLQAFRALAALAVVYYHVGQGMRREFGIDYNGPLASFGNHGVDFFFVLSGFIITWMHMADLGNPARLKSYALKRSIRIYPILWILVLLKVAACVIAPSVLKNTPLNAQSIVRSLLLVPCLFVKESPLILPQQWTLVYEALFYLIFAVWILVGKRLAAATALVWCTLILVTRGPVNNPILYHLISPFNLEFLAGCLVAVLISKSFLTAHAAIAMICISVCILVLGKLYFADNPFFFPLDFGLLVAASVSMDALRLINWPRWLLYLGDASYSIYLIHINVILLYFTVAKRANLSFAGHMQIWAHFAFFLSVLCGVICFEFAEKPTLKFIRRRQTLRLSSKNLHV